MMNIYNVDIKKYAIMLTPPFLRGTVFIGLLFAFTQPLLDLYINFLNNRKQNLIKLNFNYQACSIEHRLNDAFDKIERRIKIASSVQYQGIYLYTEAEDDIYRYKTQWLYGDESPIYLRSESELYKNYDFIVKIPNTAINIAQLRAEVDFYKLISKSYQIVII